MLYAVTDVLEFLKWEILSKRVCVCVLLAVSVQHGCAWGLGPGAGGEGAELLGAVVAALSCCGGAVD